MTQTLFGLTLKQVIEIAAREGACLPELEKVKAYGSWEEVLKNSSLRSWLLFFAEALVPSGLCPCDVCADRRTRLTPEKEALAETLQALYREATALRVGAGETHDFIAAKLRAHLVG